MWIVVYKSLSKLCTTIERHSGLWHSFDVLFFYETFKIKIFPRQFVLNENGNLCDMSCTKPRKCADTRISPVLLNNFFRIKPCEFWWKNSQLQNEVNFYILCNFRWDSVRLFSDDKVFPKLFSVVFNTFNAMPTDDDSNGSVDPDINPNRVVIDDDEVRIPLALFKSKLGELKDDSGFPGQQHFTDIWQFLVAAIQTNSNQETSSTTKSA